MTRPETTAEERARVLLNESNMWRAVRCAVPEHLEQVRARLRVEQEAHLLRAIDANLLTANRRSW